MYQIIAYLKFLLKSKNQHGVHSPFVFDLITKCVYDKANHSEYSKLKSYYESLLNNKKVISITDFGSGSRIFDTNKRAIYTIAKTSGTSAKRAQLLFRLVTYFKPSNLLELGTSMGIGTHAMALATQNANIVSIEGCPEISKVADQQLKKYSIKNVDLKIGAFSEVIPTLPQTHWDLIFFDGHHDKEATLHYFDLLLASAHNDSVFIFDDIHWSKGMAEAWNIIKKQPQVTVTIDTFFWGFVFFRKEQVKENFVIRL